MFGEFAPKLPSVLQPVYVPSSLGGAEGYYRYSPSNILIGTPYFPSGVSSNSTGLFISSNPQSSSVNASLYFFGYNSTSGYIQGYVSGGTPSNPAVVSSNTRLLSLYGNVYTGSPYNTAAEIHFITDQTSSSTAAGGAITFSTTTLNTLTRTEAMRITSSQRIGIGTSTPSFLTSISGASSGANLNLLSLENNVSLALSSETSICFNPTSSAGSVYARIGGIIDSASGSGTAALRFLTYNGSSLAEAMRITGAGNIYAGTSSAISVGGLSSPYQFYTTGVDVGLAVIGSQTANTTCAVTICMNMGASAYNGIVASGDAGIIYSGTTSGTAGGFVIAPWEGTSGIRLNGSGQVGIFTNTYTGNLTIQGTDNTYAEFIYGSATSGKSYGTAILAGTNSSDYCFVANNRANSPLFNVRGDGAVGVGSYTVNSAYIMQITGNLALTSGYGISLRADLNNMGGYAIQYVNDSLYYPIRFVGDSDSGTNRYFQFGYYASDNTASTWYPQVTINSYNGHTSIGGIAAASAQLHVYAGSSGASYNGDTRQIIESSGGTVLNIVFPNAHYGGVYFGDVTNPSSGGVVYTGSTFSGSFAAHSLLFYTATVAQMILNSSGQLGIGINPSYTLDLTNNSVCRLSAWANVAGDTSGFATFASNFYHTYNGSANVYVYTNTHGSIGYAGMVCYDGTINFYNNVGATTAGSTFTPQLTLNIAANGYVYIGPGTGTYPVAVLPGLNVAMNGNSYITVSDNTRQVYLAADSSGYGFTGTYSNHDFVIRTNNTEHARFTAGGFFGVNVNPSYQLHVIGANANTWASNITGNSTANQSYGLSVFAGTSSSDISFAVYNQNAGAQYFEVRGDGLVHCASNLTVAASVVVNGSTVEGDLTVYGAANTWATWINGSSTTNQSYGLVIEAGTSSSDDAFVVYNQATTIQALTVRGDGAVFVNTGTPSAGAAFTVQGAANYYASFVQGNTGTGTSYGLSIQAGTNSSDFAFAIHSASGVTPWAYVRGDGFAQFYAGMAVGSPTGGNKGSGTINVSSGLYLNGSAYTFPDWVMHHYFRGYCDTSGIYKPPFSYRGLLSIEENRAFVKENYKLPLMAELPDGDLFARGDLLLGSVEQCHLYIYELHDRISTLEKRLAQ